MSEPHAQWKFWGKDHRADGGTFLAIMATMWHHSAILKQNNKTKHNCLLRCSGYCKILNLPVTDCFLRNKFGGILLI